MKANQFGLIGFPLIGTLSRFGTVSRGVCRTANGCLTNVTEYAKLASEAQQVLDQGTGERFTGSELVSMNLWVLHPSIFAEIETTFLSYFDETSRQESGEIYLPQVIQNLIDRSAVTVKVVAGNSEWHGMTHKQDKEQLANELVKLTEKGIYPTPLWS